MLTKCSSRGTQHDIGRSDPRRYRSPATSDVATPQLGRQRINVLRGSLPFIAHSIAAIIRLPPLIDQYCLVTLQRAYPHPVTIYPLSSPFHLSSSYTQLAYKSTVQLLHTHSTVSFRRKKCSIAKNTNEIPSIQ